MRISDWSSDVCSSDLIDLARLAAAVAVGDRRRAIRRAAVDFLHAVLARIAIVEADYRQPEMEQVGDDREQRPLLPAMLGRGRGERAADLAVELARRPPAAGGDRESGG